MSVATEENVYTGHLSCYAQSSNSACENFRANEQIKAYSQKLGFVNRFQHRNGDQIHIISHFPLLTPHFASFPFSVPWLSFLPERQSARLFLNFKAVNLFFFFPSLFHITYKTYKTLLRRALKNFERGVVIQYKEIILIKKPLLSR